MADTIGSELTTLGALIQAARQDAEHQQWVALLDDVELITQRVATIRKEAVRKHGLWLAGQRP